MLEISNIFPEDFNYNEYVKSFNFKKLLDLESLPENANEKIKKSINSSVDPENKIAFPPELDDLCRLHYIVRSRKVTTILEFGVGKSTIIFADALRLNRQKYFDYTSVNLRRKNLYECHSVDNYEEWISECESKFPKDLINSSYINFYLAKLEMNMFNNRVCTYYDPIPNICPDLIYLDGPDQFSPEKDIRGISTRHQDRMPMSGDILSFEHFLQPGTLIVVDGRTANARFLKNNFQRNWGYTYSVDFDQHFFELQEDPLGKYNNEMINHCLGLDYYKRITN